MKKPPHTIAHLKTVLSYDPETGAFTWLVSASKRAKAGYTAGTINAAGYVQIQYDKHIYYAHILAWAFSKGRWPKVLVDHRDRDKADNRVEVLRALDKSGNGLNRAVPNKNSKTGVLGVTAHKGKFRASLCKKHLGVFDTLDEAKAAYDTAKARLLP